MSSSIQQVNFQIAWRFDDRSGAPIWNDVRNVKHGESPPPLPQVDAELELWLEGRQMIALVKQAWLGYAIDSSSNLTCTSHIWAQEK